MVALAKASQWQFEAALPRSAGCTPLPLAWGRGPRVTTSSGGSCRESDALRKFEVLGLCRRSAGLTRALNRSKDLIL